MRPTIQYLSVAVVLAIGCTKDEYPEAINTNEEITLYDENSNSDTFGPYADSLMFRLVLPPNSIPENHMVFLNQAELNPMWSNFGADDFNPVNGHTYYGLADMIIPNYYLHSAAVPITGDFDVLNKPARLYFNFPVDFTWNPNNPDLDKYHNFSDLKLYRIPIKTENTSILDAALTNSDWQSSPITWTDTLIEDYVNPFVFGYSEITEINCAYIVARRLY